MIKTVVNSAGVPVQICVICDQQGRIADYALRAGECTVSYYNDAVVLRNGINHPPLRGVWDFAAKMWRETASAQEVEAAFLPVSPAPPVEPTLEQRTAAVENAVAQIAPKQEAQDAQIAY
ncbi:MAG: hypothetical protein RSD27_11795, partial [Ruthenibacterium sp.]